MVNFTEMKKLSVISLIFSLLFILSCEDDKDTTPPELTIVSPTSGSTVGEIVQIKVQTTDESGILKVDFYIQNSMVLSDTTLPYEYEWNTTTNQDGEYKVKVVSFDTEENFVESEVSVTVDNESKKPSPLDIVSVTYDLEKMTVKWNESQDSDFKQYNLYYSLSEGGTKSLIQTYTDKSITSYDTTTFDPTKENWFFIEVVDSYDQNNYGNGMSNSIELPPVIELSKVYNDTIVSGIISFKITSTDLFGTKEIKLKLNGQEFSWSESSLDWSLDTRQYGNNGTMNIEVFSIDYFNLSSEIKTMTFEYLNGQLIYLDGTSGSMFIKTLGIDTTDITFDIFHSGTFDYSLVTEKIIIGTGGSGLYGGDLQQDKLNQIYYSGWMELNPSFSSNGNRVVFMSSGNKINFEIYRINSDGSNIYQITTNGSYNSFPKYSKNNNIGFLRDGNVYLIDEDGNNETQLTNNTDSVTSGFSFSSDGKNITYDSSEILMVYNLESNSFTDTEIKGHSPQFDQNSSDIIYFFKYRTQPVILKYDLSTKVTETMVTDNRHNFQLYGNYLIYISDKSSLKVLNIVTKNSGELTGYLVSQVGDFYLK